MVSGNMIINFKDYTISGNKIIYPILSDRRKTFHDFVAVSVDFFEISFCDTQFDRVALLRHYDFNKITHLETKT
jgi:hypothetical protein